MKVGKPSERVMENTIFRNLGFRNRNVLKGPKSSADISVVRVSPGNVMITSSDPISFIPELGPERSGFLSVQEIASDCATSGQKPTFAAFTLTLPVAMSDAMLSRYWKSIHLTCKRLGVAVVGGHTGRFGGIGYTVVGAGTMFAISRVNAYVTSDMANQDDDIILTKSAAIEATAILAIAFQETLRKRIGLRLTEKAQELFHKIGTVEDSIIASTIGLRTSLTAMHDVAEGGVLSAMIDFSEASGLRVTVDHQAIHVSEETVEVCKFFDIDPYISLGQGSLLISSRPNATRRILNELKRHGIRASIIGNFSKSGRNQLILKNGTIMPLKRPKFDPYWKAYWNATARNRS